MYEEKVRCENDVQCVNQLNDPCIIINYTVLAIDL
jgi:hypothetical protein